MLVNSMLQKCVSVVSLMASVTAIAGISKQCGHPSPFPSGDVDGFCNPESLLFFLVDSGGVEPQLFEGTGGLKHSVGSTEALRGFKGPLIDPADPLREFILL